MVNAAAECDPTEAGIFNKEAVRQTLLTHSLPAI
jgi:hypothetical protein